jgi:uncharacterized protein YbjT (DUF2867 family)
MTTTLVIGANGQIGSTLASLLAAQGQNVRRATSRATSQPGEAHVNMATREGLPAALAGADQLFLMAPPGHANQHELLIPAIDAAKAARVRKVLLLSAMGANADDSIPLRRAELHLERSGLTWNVIRPNWFMQNFHTFWLHGAAPLRPWPGRSWLPACPRACATASRSASHTLMASMKGGSPTALLPCTLSSRLGSGQRSTFKCGGVSPVAGIL